VFVHRVCEYVFHLLIHGEVPVGPGTWTPVKFTTLEVKMRAYQLASVKAWHMESVESQKTDADAALRDQWHVTTRMVRCDATNAQVWQSCKLNSMDMNISHTTKMLTADLERTPVSEITDEKYVVASLQVAEHGSGRGQLGLIEKQLTSIGSSWKPVCAPPALPMICDAAPLLLGGSAAATAADVAASSSGHDVVPLAAAVPVHPEWAQAAVPESGTLENWLLTTDAGSDVTAAKKLLTRDSSQDVLTLLWDTPCFDHQAQIMSLNILWSIQVLLLPAFGASYKDWKYYGILCSILHTWRDNASRMFVAWTNHFGALDAFDSKVHLVPPQPLSGRWGRKYACESFLVQTSSWQKVVKIFVQVVASRTYAADSDAEEGPVAQALVY
jgi:hypothetical protein